MMLLASACVQPTGDELQPTGFISVQTFTPFPSNTPLEPETVIMVVTSTIDPNAVAQEVDNTGGAAQDPIDNTVGQIPTDTLFLDENQMTATEVIRRATATVEAELTQTALAFFPIASATPTTGFVDPGITFTPVPLVPGNDCIDEVRAGDNLFRISQRYGLTVADVAARNAITNVDLIFPGQMLTIPGCGTTGYIPLPTSTPTFAPTPIGSGTTTGGTTTGGITDATTTGGTGGIFITFTPAPGVVTGGGGQCGSHVILEGESLFQIATANGVTVDSIAAANGIVNVDAIDMGETLVIPCS
jgi:LysM repeat protein